MSEDEPLSSVDGDNGDNDDDDDKMYIIDRPSYLRSGRN